MNEPKDMVMEILSDPDKLSSIMSIASSFLGGSQEPTQNDNNTDNIDNSDDTSANNDTSGFNFNDSINFNNIGDIFGGGDILGAAMPFINNVIKESSNSITPEKKQLIKALSPFAPNNISSQMNRSVKLIGIAKAAKSALNQFSKKG